MSKLVKKLMDEEGFEFGEAVKEAMKRTRKENAVGGIMRENYARGSMDQESGIMKLDEAKMLAYEPGDYNKDKYDPAMVDEYEKYKYDMQEQRPGMPIMTIDEFIRMEMKDMASAPDPMDERNTMMENLAKEYYGKPLKSLSEDEIIKIEEALDEMSKKKRKAPSIKMAEADFDPLMDEYMKYLDEMKEIDKPPMSLREFEAEARLGVRGGGLAYLMGM
jgi:uncharacterized short protein YbdD (DUF466 family)